MTADTQALSSVDLARRCAEAADAKKAARIVLLDFREVSSLCDYFVICSADNETQIKAIANELRRALKEEHGMLPNAVDGFPASQWIVVDYGDVLVHIFHHEKRAHYGLEDLWGDCPSIGFEP
jgi:ribosome-associated protein